MRAYEQSIPCSSLVADGALRGAFLGLVWGLVCDKDVGESLLAPSAHARAASTLPMLRRARLVYLSTSRFAVFVGAFAAGSCALEKASGLHRDHWAVAASGGFVVGNVFGFKRGNWQATLASGVTMAAFTGGFRYLLAQ